MIKAIVDNIPINIISAEELKFTTKDDIGHVGVIRDEHIYVLRTPNDSRTGVHTNDKTYSRYRNEEDADKYLVKNHRIINFEDTKDIRDLMKKQNLFREMTNATMTSANGNIFIPIIREGDSPVMQALKKCIRSKNINMDNYAERFGPNGRNYNNDIRLLNKNDMSNKKLFEFLNNLDLDLVMTFKDKPGNIPNPMGQTISVLVTKQENLGPCDSDEESCDLNCEDYDEGEEE